MRLFTRQCFQAQVNLCPLQILAVQAQLLLKVRDISAKDMNSLSILENFLQIAEQCALRLRRLIQLKFVLSKRYQLPIPDFDREAE